MSSCAAFRRLLPLRTPHCGSHRHSCALRRCLPRAIRPFQWMLGEPAGNTNKNIEMKIRRTKTTLKTSKRGRHTNHLYNTNRFQRLHIKYYTHISTYCRLCKQAEAQTKLTKLTKLLDYSPAAACLCCQPSWIEPYLRLHRPISKKKNYTR
jgi:hypothetical protein